MQEIIAKTARDGRKVTVGLEVRGHQLVSVATVDGREVIAHIGAHHVAVGAPAHIVAAVGPVGLTQEEADALGAAYEVMRAEVPLDLKGMRRDLMTALSCAVAEWSEDREADFDADMFDAASGFAAEIGIDDARRALDEFDAAHPEIAAEFAVDAAEATWRRMRD